MRRSVFAALGSYLYLADQKINIELHYPFKTIMQNKEEIERELMQVRTLQNTENKMLFMQILANCPTLRRRKDSNLRTGFPVNILAGCSFQPLKHASNAYRDSIIISHIFSNVLNYGNLLVGNIAIRHFYYLLFLCRHLYPALARFG